jgi:hypothetical protein
MDSGSYFPLEGRSELTVAIEDLLQIMIAFGTFVVAIMAVAQKKK